MCGAAIASRATLGPAVWALGRAPAAGQMATVRAVPAAEAAEVAQAAEAAEAAQAAQAAQAAEAAVATSRVGAGALMTPMTTAADTGDVVWISVIPM